MTIVDSARHVVGGVDTHRDVNVAAVVDMNGGLLGVESFPTTADGHRLSVVVDVGVRDDRTGRDRGHRRLWGRRRPPLRCGGCGRDRGRSTGPAEASPARQERPARRGRSGPWRVVGSLSRVAPSRVTRTPKRCGRCWSPNDRRVRRGSARIVQLRHLMFTAPDELARTAGWADRNTAGQRGRQAPPTPRW